MWLNQTQTFQPGAAQAAGGLCQGQPHDRWRHDRKGGGEIEHA